MHEGNIMLWHRRLGHCSFDKIRKMVKQGKLPPDAAQGDKPICAACEYAKATRRPCRHKGKDTKINPKPITKPGDCVSVDQMISTSPGFIAQMKGALTKQRYTAATVFVDNFSKLSYVHLQRQITSQETCEAKDQFERIARSYNVRI